MSSRPLWIWKVAGTVNQEERAPVNRDVATISEGLQQPLDVLNVVMLRVQSAQRARPSLHQASVATTTGSATPDRTGSPAGPTAIHR